MKWGWITSFSRVNANSNFQNAIAHNWHHYSAHGLWKSRVHLSLREMQIAHNDTTETYMPNIVFLHEK